MAEAFITKSNFKKFVNGREAAKDYHFLQKKIWK